MPLDDGSLVVAAGSSLKQRVSKAEKVGTALLGLGYGYGGDTFTSAALALSSVTPDGQPNTRFGRNGVVITPLLPLKNHNDATATALLRDARGRLIVVGWRTQDLFPDSGIILITAARYDAAGALDASFGDRGLINVRMKHDDVTRPSAALLDSQGRLVIAGYNGGRKVHTKLGSFDEFTNHLAVARFTTDGRLDSSFGDHGFALADIVPEPAKEELNPKCLATQTVETCRWAHKQVLKEREREFLQHHEGPAGLAIDAQNRIVAGASASDGTFVLARFLGDGKLDTTFGTSGTTRTVMPANSTIAQILIERSGRLLVVGSLSDRIALARYSADGVLQSEMRETPFAAGFVPSGAVITSDGHVFIAAAGEATLAVGQFDADGTPVKRFGHDGIVSADVGPIAGPAGLVVNAAGEPAVAALSADGVAVLRPHRPSSQ